MMDWLMKGGDGFDIDHRTSHCAESQRGLMMDLAVLEVLVNVSMRKKDHHETMMRCARL